MCADREVFLGFASASILSRNSFADVLDEATGRGYQRRFSREHSMEFRRYIRKTGSATIPLTFNLRPEFLSAGWQIRRRPDGTALLRLAGGADRVLAQVDCQHRLGHLHDVDVFLPFMAFIGLSMLEEMEIFNVINGKAKGLSSSLIDYHEAQLSRDLAAAKPEILIALRLHEDPSSPWYQRLDLGGNNTVGPHRYASLRTMQKAVKRFLRECSLAASDDALALVPTLIAFWQAVTGLLRNQWETPRKHLVTKGIGVYSLCSLAGDLVREARQHSITCDSEYFLSVLSDFLPGIDWSSHGPLRGFGGALGADQALSYIREARRNSKLRAVKHG